MIESGPISPIPGAPVAPSRPSAPVPHNAKPTFENLFKELGNFDPKTGKTRMVFVSEFIGKFAKLILGNGGGWCRSDAKIGRTFKIARFYANTKKDPGISFHKSLIEKKCIALDLLKLGSPTKKNGIYAIALYGRKDNPDSDHPIRKDIRDAIKKKPCVCCGCTNNVEPDHKNGLYNEERVKKESTQRLDDFQPACRGFNIKKRARMAWTLKHKERYPATKIPQLAPLGIDYVEGSKEYDENHPDAMKGTYDYDPVFFMKQAEKIIRERGRREAILSYLHDRDAFLKEAREVERSLSS